MFQVFSATFQSIATWFSHDWALIAAFFSANPLALGVAIVGIAGAIVLGLREPKIAKN